VFIERCHDMGWRRSSLVEIQAWRGEPHGRNCPSSRAPPGVQTGSTFPAPAQGHVGHQAVPQRGAGRACLALRSAAALIRSATTRAATGIARSARAMPPSAGSKPGKPICCRSSTTTWSSRHRRRGAADHRRRHQAPGCAHRRHACSSHLATSSRRSRLSAFWLLAGP